MKRLSLISLGLVGLVVLLNAFKGYLFFIVAGYAPNEILFTYTIVVPILIVAMILSSIVFVKWYRSIKSEEDQRIIYLVLAMPGFILGGFYLLLTIFLLS